MAFDAARRDRASVASLSLARARVDGRTKARKVDV
jgi:hypothetical protein